MSDTKWAHHSLIDPLVEPDPSDDTGLNSHFRSTFAPRQSQFTPPAEESVRHAPPAEIRPQNTASSTNTNPFRRSTNSSVTKSPTSVNYAGTSPRRNNGHPSSSSGYPSPPTSASPRREKFSPHRNEAFGSLNEGRPRRSSNPIQSSAPVQNSSGLTRGNSLRERYPGDSSHKPLDMIRKDTKTAHRAHHLRKKNFQGADTIDRLDKSTLAYHHEGPYDAANFGRNKDWMRSPVAAVANTNEEALKATPRENIINAVERHRPLEGVAVVPPGLPDRFGRVYNYEEGADLMREPGADYKRWPGMQYHPDDLKGKGEPSYTIEKALKEHDKHGNRQSEEGIEMTSHRRNRSLGNSSAAPELTYNGDSDMPSTGVGRSNTTGKSTGGMLKKRFGSLRRRKD